MLGNVLLLCERVLRYVIPGPRKEFMCFRQQDGLIV
jgi:hypothetical protein